MIKQMSEHSKPWNNCANSNRTGDEDILRITGAVTTDLVATEARYHKACHATYISKTNLYY